VRIIDQSHEIKLLVPFEAQLDLIESCGRVAYASENKITEGSSKQFVRMIVNKNHGAVLEHSMLSVVFTTDRGVSHELVRHRLASFTQESTRFCSYNKDKFAGQVTFIRPVWVSDRVLDRKKISSTEISSQDLLWLTQMSKAEEAYLNLLELGWTAQQARSVLPNSLKTKIAVTANFREWRHILQLRAIEKAAHPQMRSLMIPLYNECRKMCPEVFDLGDPE
jgi:thymidylate synthase (FAD)